MSDFKVLDQCQGKIRPTSTYVSRGAYSKQAEHSALQCSGVEQDGDLSDLYSTVYSEYCVCMKVLFWVALCVWCVCHPSNNQRFAQKWNYATDAHIAKRLKSGGLQSTVGWICTTVEGPNLKAHTWFAKHCCRWTTSVHIEVSIGGLQNTVQAETVENPPDKCLTWGPSDHLGWSTRLCTTTTRTKLSMPSSSLSPRLWARDNTSGDNSRRISLIQNLARIFARRTYKIISGWW